MMRADPRPYEIEDSRVGYSPPTSELPGSRTFVKEPDGTQPSNSDPQHEDKYPSRQDNPEHKDQALPLPSEQRKQRDRKIPSPSYTKPEGVADNPRTRGTPGGELPPGAFQNTPGGRPWVNGAIHGPPYPSPHQHEQKGEAKRYQQRYDHSHQHQNQTKAERWYKRHKKQPGYKKDQERREERPEKFERKPNGGFSSPAERTRAWREEQQHAVHRVATRWMRGFMEKRPPDGVPYENKLDRATDRKRRIHEMPGETLDISQTQNNPGSAKVIPEGHDFENREGSIVRVAVRIPDIQAGCSSDLWDKSKKITVHLKRVDAHNGMWHFAVSGSKDNYTVKVQAKRIGASKDVGKVDVLVACSCPFWQWQGPEHWAKEHGYLYGRPRGTAAGPVVRDPNHQHGACKHVLATFDFIISQGWQVLEPHGKTASTGFRYLASNLCTNDIWCLLRGYPY